MAQKKPLVLGSSGLPEQLQSGDYLVTTDIPQYNNAEGTSLVPGTAVYVSAASSVRRARGNAVGTTTCIGLAVETISAGTTGGIQVDGVLALTTGEWDAITGSSGGLAPGSRYFLSDATAGFLTAIPPTAIGSFVQSIGVAVSTTELIINPLYPIKL